jgi:hypothetical protein
MTKANWSTSYVQFRCSLSITQNSKPLPACEREQDLFRDIDLALLLQGITNWESDSL